GLVDEHGKLQSFAPPDGLRVGTVRAIHEDAVGTVWFGGTEGLAFLTTANQLVTLSRKNGLPSDSVSAVIDDQNGNIWIGTAAGIVRVDHRDIANIFSDSTYPINYALYDVSDGLAGVPMRFGSPSAARDRDGRLWFVTANGLTVVDPRRADLPHLAPPVRIESLIVDGRPSDVIAPVRIPAGASRLEFDYTAFAFSSPGKLRFR